MSETVNKIFLNVNFSVALVFGIVMPAHAEQACLKSVELVKKGVQVGDGSDAEIALYNEAIQICPQMVEAYFNMGLALQKKGDFPGAEAKLREAIKLKDEETFRVGLAGVLLQKGEVSASKEQYERVLEQNPQSVPALQGLAVILEKQQKIPDAIVTLQKAATVDPANYLTFFNLGVLQEKLQQYDAAAVSYKKAVDLNPKHFESKYLLGMMQSRLGNVEEARRSLQAAAEMKPDDIRVHLALGEVYEKLGELHRCLQTIS